MAPALAVSLGPGAAPVIRRLLLLAAVLAAVAAADGWVRRARDSGRAEAAVLRGILPPSGQVEPDRVRSLSLQAPGSSPWVYERRGDSWRFPAYFGAYAHSGRVDRLLHEVLGASGTLVSTDEDDFDDLGVSGPQSVRLTLAGNAGESLGEIWIGKGVPGPSGAESYVRRAGSDSVLHLHANPLLIVGSARPPMLDPHLLPRDERGGSVVEVLVTAPAETYRLRRVLAPMPEDTPALPLPSGDRERYRWLLQRESGEDRCVDASVWAYLSYLRQVRVERLVDPAAAGGYGFGAARVELTDEEGVRDVLQVGGAAAGDERYVRNARARLTAVLTAVRAEWLIPPADVVLDTLAQPSPFEGALR